MEIFEETCQTLELADQKFTHDIDLLVITMQLANQHLTEFFVNKDKSVIKIVQEPIQGTNETKAYILVSIQDMSMNFDLDFKILSDPARSTKINLLVLWLLPSFTTCFSVTKQWDLEDLSLIAWLFAVLVASTSIMISIISSVDYIGLKTWPFISQNSF